MGIKVVPKGKGMRGSEQGWGKHHLDKLKKQVAKSKLENLLKRTASDVDYINYGKTLQKKQLGGPIQRSKDDQPLAYGNPAIGGPVAARGGYVKKYARGGGIRKIKG